METLQELVDSFKDRSGTALRSRKVTISYRELYKQVVRLAGRLLALGLKPGDRVMLLSTNSPEWLVWNLSINYAGLVDVPRGEFVTPGEVRFIREHSQAVAAVVQNKCFYEMLGKPGDNEKFIIIGMSPIAGTLDLDQSQLPENAVPRIAPDDPASLIYTSGTTGQLKGVTLTHRNFTSNVEALLDRIEVDVPVHNDKALSILPAWHTFERIIKYSVAARGIETFYSDKHHLMVDFEREKPTIIGTVPRLWEMVYHQINLKLQKPGVFNRMAANMINAALKAENTQGLHYRILRKMTDLLVFPRIRRFFGGRLRCPISGGSPLAPHIDDFFRLAGINIFEGYGLTETSPVIAVRSEAFCKPYTVGKPLDNLKVRIVDPENGLDAPAGMSGVIYVKGPSVTPGYFRDYEQTQRSFHDGFFNTGDLGEIDAEGFLKVNGRRDDMLVLSNGENIQPEVLERALSSSALINTALVVGHGWKALGAMILPEFESLERYCRDEHIGDGASGAHLLDNPAVKRIFHDEIEKCLKNIPYSKPYYKITEFCFIRHSLEPGLELTSTLKPRRRSIIEKYKTQYNAMEHKINRS